MSYKKNNVFLVINKILSSHGYQKEKGPYISDQFQIEPIIKIFLKMWWIKILELLKPWHRNDRFFFKECISTTCDCAYTGSFFRHHWMLIFAKKVACYLLAWGLFELTKHKIFLPITVTIVLNLTMEELNGEKRKLMMGKEDYKCNDLWTLFAVFINNDGIKWMAFKKASFFSNW